LPAVFIDDGSIRGVQKWTNAVCHIAPDYQTDTTNQAKSFGDLNQIWKLMAGYYDAIVPTS
jgi:hypothetical protein